MLRNVSINGKGALLLSLPTITIIALLVPLVFNASSLEEALEESEHIQELATSLDSVQSALVKIHSENLQYALMSSSEMPVEIQLRAESAEQSLTTLTANIERSAIPAKELMRFAAEARVMLARLPETHMLLREGALADGRAAAADDERDLRTVAQLGERIRQDVRRRMIARFGEINRLSARGILVPLGGSIAAIVIVITIGWMLLRSMLWRLHTIQENVSRMEQNKDLIPPVLATDEIGRIDAATHKMVRSLRAQQSENEMFIYSVSHDLRSPLVNLQGFGSELRRATEELSRLMHDVPDVPEALATPARQLIDDDMAEALRFIDLAVQRQAKIIDSLLSLSRAGRVDYRWQNVDLDEQLRDLVGELQKQLPDGGSMGIEGALPPVHGDPDAIVRVFENLLGNAIKYRSPDRPLSITIEADEESLHDMATIRIRDNGVGMTAAQCEEAVLPFSRYAGGEGEGIGLSLVKRVVDRHHGALHITSEPAVGTTVRVSLMRARSEEASA